MAEKSSTTPMKRVSRACLHCRQRKSKCDLDASGGSPPCERCKRDGRECVLGGSNRGGSRIRKKTLSGSILTAPPLQPFQENGQNGIPQTSPVSAEPSSDGVKQLEGATTNDVPSMDMDDDTASTTDSAVVAAIPRNPSDAWQLLTDVATRGVGPDSQARGEQYHAQPRNALVVENTPTRGSVNGGIAGISSYYLVQEGYLNAEMVSMLVGRFAEHYHPYLPLVPRKYFDLAQLDSFATNNKHLLTAVLTISSKDLIEQPNVHLCCSRYMHDLISGVAAGHDCDVEAVEALLLLAEWEPQGLRDRVETVGRGEEDRSAWMHVGMALRTGYFLGLDRTSFRSEEEEAKNDGRKRLAWASCYVSDRLISVRIGRAFWSRGPGPMTGLSNQDFPSLQPLGPGDEDYARIFQATLDLTQLYSNVHDVLYSGMRTSGQMMLMGDYVKYVDEFRAAIAQWNRIWGTLMCSQHIKVTLQMSYEYLRLYTNAFAFQAAISQAISSNKSKGDAHSRREHLCNVFSNIGAMPDGRFIWASVAAAKSYLTILNTYVDPIKHLRYMPLRFYLYSIYSAVFLYKARSFGVMDQQEEHGVRQMVLQTMDVLRRASISPQDPGFRYARLLELLWQKPKANLPAPNSGKSPDIHRSTDSQYSSGGSLTLDASGYMQFSPANDFSWLDLEAVGDFVSGDQMAGAGLLPPMAGFQSNPSFVPQVPGQQTTQWQQPGSYACQFDLNGNLLF